MNKRKNRDKNIRPERRNFILKPRVTLLIKTVLLLALFISYSIYLFWRFYYTIPTSFGYISLVAGYILFIAEAAGFIESSMFYLTLWDTETKPTPEVGDKPFPDVDVFIATYNEPNDLLYKTLIGCKNMDYPDKNKVHIYICDDGNRAEVKNLCEKLEIGYITRTDNAHAKAGNLNNALSKTSSPYVVTFDADMIPMNDFLLKTIPFFMVEEKVGFIQVPQNFYNPDLFQYNLFSERITPNEQNLFARLLQAGKSKFNAIIYAGSNTVLSRQALDEIGGLVVGTITEDFATGMKIQSRGYRCYALNEVHASGLSPESLEDLYSQRIRWGRGVIQTFKAFNPLFMKGLNFFQKLLYFSAFSYWYFGIWRLIFFLAPIFFSVFGIIVLSTDALQMLKVWLPMYVFTNLTFVFFTKGIRSVSWTHVYDTILFPQITKGVIIETFGFKMSKFKVTPKENVKRDSYINRFELVKVQIVLAILSFVGMIRITYAFFINNFELQYLINLFWLSYNFYLLIMAVFFASERPKFRNSERIFASEEATLTVNGQTFSGRTGDISESGVSIILDKPIYIDKDENQLITVITERNFAKFLATIIRVDNVGLRYKYVFKISEIAEENFAQYLLILYDRVPSFPEKQGRDYLITNVIKYIKSRRKKMLHLNRKLPRININRNVKIVTEDNVSSVYIQDFNYMFIAVKGELEHEDFIIPLDRIENKYLQCVYDRNLSIGNKKDTLIYKVTNYQEFVSYDLASILQNYEEDNLEFDLDHYKINSDANFPSNGLNL